MEIEPTQCLKKKCNREYKHAGLCNKKKVQCTIKKVCSKQDKHGDECDERYYWHKAPQTIKKKHKREVNDLVKKKIKLDELNLGIEQKINNNEAVVNSLHQIKTQLSNDMATCS